MKRKLAISITTIFILLSSYLAVKDNYKIPIFHEEAKEIEDLKANVKELEETKNNEEDSLDENSEQNKALKTGDLKDIESESDKKKPENLSDIIMANIDQEINRAKSSIVFEKSIDLIKNNPEIFLDDSASDSMINMFNHLYWDEISLDPSVPKHITLTEGAYLREYKASKDTDKFNVYQVGFFPNPGRDDVHYFTVFYCGNVRNYLYPNPHTNKNDYLKVRALPVAVLEIEDDEGKTLTTYIFVSSDTFQHTAYKYFEYESY